MKLTAKHMRMIELLADPEDGRTDGQKCKDAGFSQSHLSANLYKDPDFLRELNRRTEENQARYIAKADRTLWHAMDSKHRGEAVQAAVAVLKRCGRIGSGVNVTTNVSSNGIDADKLEAWRSDRLRRAGAPNRN